MLHPKNDYVKAFVQDAPRSKVLTAAAVMAACPPGFDAQARPTVPHDAYLEMVLPLVASYDAPLAVVNGVGAPLGYVDRALVLRALVQAE